MLEAHHPKELIQAGVRLDRAAGRKGSEAWSKSYWRHLKKIKQRGEGSFGDGAAEE
jgi:hypothetical protein